jgi:hypothetical protein
MDREVGDWWSLPMSGNRYTNSELSEAILEKIVRLGADQYELTFLICGELRTGTCHITSPTTVSAEKDSWMFLIGGIRSVAKAVCAFHHVNDGEWDPILDDS